MRNKEMIAQEEGDSKDKLCQTFFFSASAWLKEAGG